MCHPQQYTCGTRTSFPAQLFGVVLFATWQGGFLTPLFRPKTSGVRLLGALRVWRVARVMNTLLLSADEAHEETRDTLRVAEKVMKYVCDT